MWTWKESYGGNPFCSKKPETDDDMLSCSSIPSPPVVWMCIPCKLLSISCCLVWTAPCLVQMAETNVRILLFHFLVMSFCSIYWFTRLTNWCFGSRGCDGMASMSNIVMQLHIDACSYRGISAALSSGIVCCLLLPLTPREIYDAVCCYIHPWVAELMRYIFSKACSPANKSYVGVVSRLAWLVSSGPFGIATKPLVVVLQSLSIMLGSMAIVL